MEQELKGLFTLEFLPPPGKSGPLRQPLFNRLVSRTEIGLCWLWQGPLDLNGYARVSYGRKKFMAHRLMWEFLCGPIPHDLVVDHLCRVRHCLNPDHLELVTVAENTRRGFASEAMKTLYRNKKMCRNNLHQMTEENTLYLRGSRRCLTCFNVKKKRDHANLKAKR